MRWLLLIGLCSAVSGLAAQDEACLACHGERDLRAPSGRSLYVPAARHRASVHGPLGCTGCHSTIRDYPHPGRIPKVDCGTCHSDATENVPGSAHGFLGQESCVACHGKPHEIGRAAGGFTAQCASCHAAAVAEFSSGVHGQAKAAGTADTPTCQSCHGPAHLTLPSRDPASPVARRNLPETCGACHANPEFLARHKIPFARPVEAFRLSVHGRALARGNAEAASCSDCHASHGIYAARDPRSQINHWKVPQTCGACHSGIAQVFAQSVHGDAVRRGVPGAPVCTDCHGEHAILAPSEPHSLVNPARVSSVTCGHCHANERLVERYNLPLDKVPAFEDSFHGLAQRAGSQTVANCASCHGVHNILPSSDPRSTVHPANLASTCGSCHPGAGARFALGPVHVQPATATEHPVVKWIRILYWLLIPLTVGFMLLHNAVDFLAKLIRGHARHASDERVPRMNIHFRIAHGLVVLSFPVLVVTGFALKFPDSWWAAPLLQWESQVAFRGTLHRIAGVVLLAACLYHVAHLVASRRDRAILRHLLLRLHDFADSWALLKFNLGWAKERPRFGKFSYAEKIEYWAFIWGTVIMTLSGFLLWFNNFTLRNFPKWVSDAATAIHYYEAILATLSILVWHFYLVIFDPDVYPMDRAWLTGETSGQHLRETRPDHYLELILAAAEKVKRTESAFPAPTAAVPASVEGKSEGAETGSAGPAEDPRPD